MLLLRPSRRFPFDPSNSWFSAVSTGPPIGGKKLVIDPGGRGLGIAWLSVRSHVIPFVVLVDNLGRPVASGVADQTSLNDDRLRRSDIFNWVENLRTITTDGVSQRKAIDRVYAQIASGSAAQTFISEFYRGDPPFKRAETETVSVEVKSVLPTSDRTNEVKWVETTRDLYGAVKATDRWKGYFAIALNPRPRTSAKLASIPWAFISRTRAGQRFSEGAMKCNSKLCSHSLWLFCRSCLGSPQPV